MNTNKTIKIRYTSYKMFQNGQTGWVFVGGQSSRTKNHSFPVGKIVDGQIAIIENTDVLHGVTNEELLIAFRDN